MITIKKSNNKWKKLNSEKKKINFVKQVNKLGNSHKQAKSKFRIIESKVRRFLNRNSHKKIKINKLFNRNKKFIKNQLC